MTKLERWSENGTYNYLGKTQSKSAGLNLVPLILLSGEPQNYAGSYYIEGRTVSIIN
jgi:hypothetical protein